jgi:uncharacterized membrane protein
VISVNLCPARRSLLLSEGAVRLEGVRLTVRTIMGLGTGIALLVVGGILAFGVKDSFSAVDLTAIGYICMGAGVLAIILTLVLQQQRQRTSHTSVVERRDLDGGGPPVV